MVTASAPATVPDLTARHVPANDLLVSLDPLDLPIYLPLTDWARQILATLDKYKPAADATACAPLAYGGMVGCFNQAGLIETCFGRTAHAAVLCDGALGWMAQWLPRTGDLSLARLAFQPQINLGRLERITARFDRSLERFQGLRELAERQLPATLGPLRITAEHWAAMLAAKPNLSNFFVTGCVMETVKTLLKARRYACVLEYAAANRQVGNGKLSDAFCEASILACFHLGLLERARTLVEERLGGVENRNQPIFVLRWIESLALAGDDGEAFDAVLRLSEDLRENPDDAGTSSLRVLAELAAFSSQFAREECLRACETGLDRAVALSDVRLQMKFLAIIAKTHPDGAIRSEALARGQALKWSSLYGAASTPGEHGGHIADLYRRLTELS
jgi:hypothetical protein